MYFNRIIGLYFAVLGVNILRHTFSMEPRGLCSRYGGDNSVIDAPSLRVCASTFKINNIRYGAGTNSGECHVNGEILAL